MMEQEQRLEQLLEQAYSQDDLRWVFISHLLDSTVYFLGSINQSSDALNAVALEKTESVHIFNWTKEDGSAILPFFSSLQKLQYAISEDQPYLKMQCRSFFELTEGACLVLNPNCGYGKEFMPDEILHILKVYPEAVITEPKAAIDQTVTAPSTGITGYIQPDKYPLYMLEKLRKLFELQSNISAAYLVEMNLPDQTKQSFLICIALFNNCNDAVKEELRQNITGAARQTLPHTDTIGVQFVDSQMQQELRDYIAHETKAFYQRENNDKRGIFAKLFG